MKNDLVLSMTMNDLIFTGRNKSYGAYLLRSTYDTNMTKGIFFGVGIFLLFITSPLFDNNKNRGLIPPIYNTDKFDTTVVILRARPTFIQPISAGSMPAENKKVKSEVPKVVTDDDKTIKANEPDKVSEENPIPSNSSTMAGGSTEGTNSEGFNSLGTESTDETPATNDEEYGDHAEEMPEFPGGITALYKYLSKKVRYPEIAFQNGIEGTVLVQFVVDREGNINRTKVVRKLGGGCDEEAVRIISGMPKWKPGKMGGKNVSVMFTLPIKFKIEKI